MGYYTKFLLTHDYVEEVEELELWDSFKVQYGEQTDALKWYDNHADLLAHSAKYPLTTFTLQGDGEESDDKWIHRYRGGVFLEDKRGSTIFGFEAITRRKMEDEIVKQISGVFSPEDVVFALNGVKRALDKLGVE